MPARLREALGEAAAVNVIVVERNSEIGPDLGPGPRPVITQAMTELGVKWKLGSGVAAVRRERRHARERRAHRLGHRHLDRRHSSQRADCSDPGASATGFGRLHVDRNQKVKGLDTVYATGDVAYAATDDEGNYALMSCQHAQNMGRFAGHNAAADLLGTAPIPYSQPKYATCLDLGPWGAVYTEGWDRQVKLVGAEAKALKTQINTEWIYPPSADRAEALASADPRLTLVA